ncbi:PA14 domain protein [Planctomycetes bacterium Pan216]|uniref:PA14 domain protein n=1 Tax=Kolteria novifilia TaxID=2527975 RepID=A0A518B687_9BACT|nr:PA14 domain protein [Planctomycetes bacterium Pan216]
MVDDAQHQWSPVLTSKDLSRFVFAVLALSTLTLSTRTTVDAADGAKIYKQHCASCHGGNGEGSSDYDSPLTGDLAISELAKIITETMPEEDPDQCVGENARAVAEYIHKTFYSPVARERSKLARLSLSRLTVRQHRQIVADLLGSFSGIPVVSDDRGLKAHYYGDHRHNHKKKAFERRDAAIDFDFGEFNPTLPLVVQPADAEKKKKPKDKEVQGFAIRWEGSLIAPESGTYRIVLESKNSVVLWINDRKAKFIDGQVHKTGDNVYEKTIDLIGGRAYPLRLDMSAHREWDYSVKLSWVPPHGVKTVIPKHCLMPTTVSETFVLETPFPPDDRSMGYERGNAVSPEWDRATTAAALEVADHVASNLKKYAKGTDKKKVKAFSEQFAERAFRRPLPKEYRDLFAMTVDKAPSMQEAVKRIVLLTLKSPRFLYVETGRGPLDQYGVATSLSLGLWDSLPDEPLRKAAAEGNLKTRQQIEQQAKRMVKDSRAQTKVCEFLHEWLALNQMHGLAKDPQAFPGFDEQVAADLRTSLDLFIGDVVASDNADFRELLLSDSVFLNGRLAKYYGVKMREEADFSKVQKWEPENRSGVLTHPYMLAGLAYRNGTSPIHRGVFLTRFMLGRVLKPPPVAIAPTPVDLHPSMTTRERVALQTNSAECMRCHRTINQLGFALEQFDGVGVHRTKESGKSVDASGTYLTQDDQRVSFNGAEELARYLAKSPEVHANFVQRLFQYMTKQPIRAIDDDFHAQATKSFAERKFNIRDLAVYLVTEGTFRAFEQSERSLADSR